ncbi:MAG: hypothetical protein JXR44_04965 [Thiotrichales bacterium]|nr:hypothetical protein [Thiotrichales bacterium]
MTKLNEMDALLDAVEGLELPERDRLSDVHSPKPTAQSDQANRLESQNSNLDQETKILLETAKTTQDAAHQSQEATQAALKLAEQLRVHTQELSSANLNWRQAIRHSAQEIAQIQKAVGVMLVISFVLSFVAVGMMVTLYFELQNQQQQSKGEMLEMLQAENALFTKALTVKIDDLGNQIEASRYFTEQMLQNHQGLPSGNPLKMDPQVSSAQAIMTAETEAVAPQANTSAQTSQQAFEELLVQIRLIEQRLSQIQSELKQAKWVNSPPITSDKVQEQPAINELRKMAITQGQAIERLTQQMRQLIAQVQQDSVQSSRNALESGYSKALIELRLQQQILHEGLEKLQNQQQELINRLNQLPAPYSYKAPKT